METPLGERSERSEQSDQDGLGELPSESCSKDAFRVREGRLRKAIQHAYARQTCLVWLARVPAKFHLQRASRSYVNTRFPKNAPGITFSTVLGLPGVASWHRFFNKNMENVDPGPPRTRQTAATDVSIFSKLLWLEFGTHLWAPRVSASGRSELTLSNVLAPFGRSESTFSIVLRPRS